MLSVGRIGHMALDNLFSHRRNKSEFNFGVSLTYRVRSWAFRSSLFSGLCSHTRNPTSNGVYCSLLTNRTI